MKNIFFVLAAVYCSASLSAQKVAADKVPAAVSNIFKAKFPSATDVKWEMEHATNYEAGFKTGNTEKSALFDKNGKWLETETEIKASELPAPVTKTISAQYAGYKLTEPEKVETADKGTLYEVELVKGKEVIEVQFTADGKVLKSKKEQKH